MIAVVQACWARVDRAERAAADRLLLIQEAGARSSVVVDLYATSDSTTDVAARVREARADLDDALAVLRPRGTR